MRLADPVPDQSTTGLFFADIVSVEENRLTLDRNGTLLSAFRATSLLLDPLPGDQAVGLVSEDGICLVVATFSLQSGLSRSLTFPDGLKLGVSGGSLAVDAPGGVRIETGDLDVAGTVCRARFSDIIADAARVAVTGNLLSFAARKIGQIAESVETVARWISEKAFMATRDIETVDRSTAGERAIESESVLSVRAKTTIVDSPDWVKVDSNQIHLG